MKNPVKKPSWWDEFAAFAIKGNAMALRSPPSPKA